MNQNEAFRKLEEKTTKAENFGFKTGKKINQIVGNSTRSLGFLVYLAFFGLLSFIQGVINGISMKSRES